MFQKKYRLPYYIRFSHPHTIISASFTLKLVKNGLLYNRYGIIAGKTVDRRATKRNRIKRQIRFCIESLQPKVTHGYDVLFIVKKTAEEKLSAELVEEIQAAYKKEAIL